MKAWFDRLPIHRKMVATAVAVTIIALTAVTFGLVGVDLWRYRADAIEATQELARVLADNAAPAIGFEAPEGADETLSSVQVRPEVRRACLFTLDGRVFGQFARANSLPCSAPTLERSSWSAVFGRAEALDQRRRVGTVYVEQDLPGTWTRVAVGVSVGLFMMASAVLLAYVTAQRLHRTISEPIGQLADAARAIGPEEQQFEFPSIEAPPDEVGQLVRSFSDMVGRVRTASTRLVESNQEREQALVREREASRLKDEFLATVSHELRTPLNAIVGWTYLLRGGTLDAETSARAIDSIGRNVQVQTRLIDDLVDVSRIVTGKLRIRREVIDLRAAVEGALDVVRADRESKRIAVTVRIPDVPCRVNGDHDRLQQVVVNLLSNAVKFTPAGGAIAVRVELLPNDVEVVVTDTGIGITATFLPHVFDRFRQADGSTTRSHDGLGLGLSIVQQLTELHGGSVVATSGGPGTGATFVVRLPRVTAADSGVAGEPTTRAELGSAEPHLSDIRVLVVDDNVDALETVAATLTRAGAEVRVANSGPNALAAYDQDPPDVIVCDLAMPGMDGFAVLSEVRRRDAVRGGRTSAVALTAHASDAHVELTRAAGFDAHVSKPFDPATLSHAVATARKTAR